VLVDPAGKAYGPGDISGPPKIYMRAADVAHKLGINRSAVHKMQMASRNPDYRGSFPREVAEGLWDPNDINQYKLEREKS
jgi:hypothetical protein